MMSRLASGMSVVLSTAFVFIAAQIPRTASPAAAEVLPGTFLEPALGISLLILLGGGGRWLARIWLGATGAIALAGIANTFLLVELFRRLEDNRLLTAAMDGAVWGCACVGAAALAWFPR